MEAADHLRQLRQPIHQHAGAGEGAVTVTVDTSRKWAHDPAIVWRNAMHAQSIGTTVIISTLVGAALVIAPYAAEMFAIWL